LSSPSSSSSSSSPQARSLNPQHGLGSCGLPRVLHCRSAREIDCPPLSCLSRASKQWPPPAVVVGVTKLPELELAAFAACYIIGSNLARVRLRPGLGDKDNSGERRREQGSPRSGPTGPIQAGLTGTLWGPCGPSVVSLLALSGSRWLSLVCPHPI